MDNKFNYQEQSTFEYEGNVTWSITVNGKKVNISSHNAGTEYLQRAFAALMSGNLTTAKGFIPKFIDIMDSTGTVSYLYSPAPITGSRYEKQLTDWVAIHNCSITEDNISSHPSTPVTCKAVILDASSRKLASWDISSEESINLITENASGLITWIMKLKVS